MFGSRTRCRVEYKKKISMNLTILAGPHRPTTRNRSPRLPKNGRCNLTPMCGPNMCCAMGAGRAVENRIIAPTFVRSRNAVCLRSMRVALSVPIFRAHMSLSLSTTCLLPRRIWRGKKMMASFCPSRSEGLAKDSEGNLEEISQYLYCGPGHGNWGDKTLIDHTIALMVGK
ncbi:MAG: hypothetical protein ACD_62C00222G0005 [uncultured bacterium]|nr:MAG: hypothetical protein ACD_62C00222G0005 [uncultured bacterium]